MQSSSPDLVACGTKVHLSSVRESDGKKSEADAGGKKGKPSRRFSTDRQQSRSYRRQLTELTRTLNFSDDVVTSRSSEPVSYAKAKHELPHLFKTAEHDLGLAVPKPSETVGRHDCRGEPKRHIPCHLRYPVEDNLVDSQPQRIRTQRHSLPPMGPRSQMFLSEVDPESLVLERAKVIPPSVSVQWEEQTLYRLSSATARRLITECATGRERGRLETLMEGKHKQATESLRKSEDGSSGRELQYEKSRTIADLKRKKPSESFIPGPSDIVPPARDFLSELQEGALPVHQKKGDGRTIVLDSKAQFDKVVQRSYPEQPRDWCKTDASAPAPLMGRTYMKGYQKWTDLPQLAKTPEDLQWECQQVESPTSSEKTFTLPASEDEQEEREGTPNLEFFDIMEEWCKKWHIHIQPKEISEAAILENLHSLCDNSRMFAIASLTLLAKSLTSKPRVNPSAISVSVSSEDSPGSRLSTFAGELFRLLEDPAEHVRVPAAITLYCLGKQNEKTELVLHDALAGRSPSEQWASVQCLAVGGASSAPLVRELLLASHQPGTRERAAELLARTSARTPLVHAMLAEQLNSSGWQERLTTCLLLPRLHGGINKDLCSKLVVLSWEDWSPEVRRAAAQALGLTGHGKLIHDEIQRRLEEGPETVRLDALKRLHSLQLMTPQLLPAFLSCFSDDHISIRTEATTIAASLRLGERQVLHALQRLLQDPCWKVKAHALRALGEIGACEESLLGQLLWAVRFEKLPAVRAEACHALATLGVREERVVHTLRDRLTVEDDPLVLREVTLALQRLGSDTETEDAMLATIRSEVQRLGTRGRVTEEVLHSERKTTTDYVLERPREIISTRDYLNDRQRHKMYSSVSPLSEEVKRQSPKKDAPLRRRSWSPDRQTIDRQLEAMRRRCVRETEVVT